MPAPTLPETLATVTADTTALAGVTDLLTNAKLQLDESLETAMTAIGTISGGDQATLLAAIDDTMTAAIAAAQSIAFALWANVPAPHPGAGQSVVGNLKPWS